MNPVIKIINNILIAINRLIDSMSLKTIKTIQRGFFFVTFIMCIAGIIIGYNMGTKSAKIKSPPLAENVNDVFNIDISREKDMGSFSGMLESETIKVDDTIHSVKDEYLVRESIKTERDDKVLDPGKTVEEPDLDEKVYKSDKPVDADKDSTGRDEGRIRSIDRSFNSDISDDTIIRDKTRDDKTSPQQKTTDEKTDIRLIDKNKTVSPKTIKKDEGKLEQ